MKRSLDDIATGQGITGIIVEVLNPETPFGGVQVFGAADVPILIEFGRPAVPGGGGGGGPSVPTTFNLLSGDGLGNVLDSGILPANVVQKQTTFPTPTTLNTVIACLKAAGLCA